VFEGFANVWTIVARSRDLPPGVLRPVRVAGERVVLFRAPDGRAAALIDRCPHRGAALSLGTLRGGEIECPFHGWRFDSGGANRAVPWNPDARCAALGATPVPVRERAGMLWLHTGQEPANEPEPCDSLRRPGVRVTYDSVLWRCHWTRAMENMLDVPHLPFVHRRTIGRDLAAAAPRTMETVWTETAWGARIDGRIEGRERPIALNFLYPNAMELVIDPPRRLLRVMAVCLPEGPRATRMIFFSIRSFARSRLLDPLFGHGNRRIAREDQAVIESSDPPEVPEPDVERSVRTDAPTLAFRKLYFERLKGSSATLAPA
jgi:phenylpropionate dioxygenase-like ring-hydroxylating dioxygenase large terminal subunit